MTCLVRLLAVFAFGIACFGCGGTVVTPTAPTRPVVSASILTINGFTTLSGRGETGRLTALVTFSDGSVRDESQAAEWFSADQAIATVGTGGMVTAMNDGHTTVTATFANVTGSRAIKVDLP